MPAKNLPETSALVAAAQAFDDSLGRFAMLTKALMKGPLESRQGLGRAAETLQEIATCEEDLQAQAQALMAALGAARDAQLSQGEQVRVRALEIQQRSEEYAAITGRFEAVGRDAADLNARVQALAARRRAAGDTLPEADLPSLLAELDELQERMTAVAVSGDGLATDARTARFEELARESESLRQQLLAARNKVGLLKEALGKAAAARSSLS